MIKTEEEFKETMKSVAKDAISNGFDLYQCAGDLADCQLYDSEVKEYVLKHNPWIRTKTQFREFIVDCLVG